MLIENGIAEAIHFFHIDALSSMVGLKVDFDLQLTLMGSALYRLLAQRLAENYHRATAKNLFNQLLKVPGKIPTCAIISDASEHICWIWMTSHHRWCRSRLKFLLDGVLR